MIVHLFYIVRCISLFTLCIKRTIQERPIEEQPWYFHDISRDNAVAVLKRDGDYLVRYSTTTKGYVCGDFLVERKGYAWLY